MTLNTPYQRIQKKY